LFFADLVKVNSDVPYLLLFNNTGSPALSLVLNIILFLLIYAGNITALATCAREMWAFARDKGLVRTLAGGTWARERSDIFAAL
jgi:amino acid transporter